MWSGTALARGSVTFTPRFSPGTRVQTVDEDGVIGWQHDLEVLRLGCQA